MARLEDIQKEKKLLEDISNFRRKDGEINLRYREKYNNLVQQELSLEAKIAEQTKVRMKAIDDSVKSAKIYAKLSSDAEKSEASLDKSLSSRLSNLVKGNVAGFIQLKSTKDYSNLQNKLNTNAKDNADIILNSGKTTESQKLSLLQINDEIKSGLLEEGQIGDRINSIEGLKQNVKTRAIKAGKELLGTQKSTALAGAKSAADMSAFTKFSAKAAGIYAVLYQLAQQFAGQLDAIGKTFGSINELGDDFQDTLMDSTVTATRLGGGIEDVAGITANLASNFGIGLDAAAGLSAQILDTSKAVGLSTDEASNLFGVLMQTSNLSAEQAERLGEGAFQLARANQVNPAQVLRDIAGSSETIALFTKDGAGNIADAAVQARKFGISLDTSAKIAEGLLDFENSIAKEVEASVLIGRQLNLQKAREAALTGDISTAMKEVVKQVGSEEEFNRLNLIQRKALADSIGVSVADMSKLVGETAKAGVQAKGFRDLFGSEGLSDFTLLMNELKATTVGLVNALGPGLMAIAKILNLLIKLVQPLIDGINFVFKGISSAIDFSVDMLPSAARPVNDVKIDKGGASVIAGPAGVFSLNPKDSVLATTNPIPVNDMGMNTTNGNSTVDVNVNLTGKSTISGRNIDFFVEAGKEFAGGEPGQGQ